MHITIIGTGNVGGALAENWASKGHHIHLGVRDTSNFKGQHLLSVPNITVHTIGAAVILSEVILIAAAPQHTQSIVESMGDISSKVMIDAMNSIRTRPDGYTNSFEALKSLTRGAEIVKCFNTTGYENMKDPIYHGEGIDVFMAGDSKKAKEIAKQLALDAGFSTCYDFGGDDKVALLEQFALCWINLAIMQGQGRDIAFRVVRRQD
ncbi:MAG TPA: NAD(P)-binding domain-containing protein [Saprospiraceae bacterium]|nr:NAD(P)-binding domain-containing protein [Saprospiraceae bacterium]